MTTTKLPPLPALRSVGDLADTRPTIIVDSREQTPLVFTRLASRVSTLQTGDYSFAGGEELFAVERKSVSDLVGCCMGENRDRFERELHRLRGFRFARLLIVGHRLEIEQHRYRSNISPKAVLSTLAAFEARYIPVVWSDTPDLAAQLIERWAWWYCRELLKQASGLLAGCQAASGATTPMNAPGQSKSLREAIPREWRAVCKVVWIPAKADTDSENNRTPIPIQIGQFSERSDARVLAIKNCPK